MEGSEGEISIDDEFNLYSKQKLTLLSCASETRVSCFSLVICASFRGGSASLYSGRDQIHPVNNACRGTEGMHSTEVV